MIPHFDPTRFIIEAIFTGVIILLCFAIFFKTKEIYNLTKHKGIGFFRVTFLLFGIAHIFRFLFALSHILIDPHLLQIPKRVLMLTLMIPVSFIGTLAFIYLLYSTIWKRYKNHTNALIIIATIVSLISSLATFVFRSKEIMILLQALIFIIIIIVNIKSYIAKKKTPKLFYIYILMFIFWIVNISFIGIQKRWLSTEFMVFSQIISIIIFAIIYYKVSKWTK